MEAKAKSGSFWPKIVVGPIMAPYGMAVSRVSDPEPVFLPALDTDPIF